MSLLGLLDDVNNDGFVKGGENYIGNSTNFGQTLNGAGNVFQNMTGSPQHQMIGTPPTPQNTNSAAPYSPPTMQDAIKAHATKAQMTSQTPTIGAQDNSSMLPPLATQGQGYNGGSQQAPVQAGAPLSAAGIANFQKGIGMVKGLGSDLLALL